jgi:hypothetical protein
MRHPTAALAAAIMALFCLQATSAVAVEAVTAKQCIGDDDTGYAQTGKTFTFTMNFHNDCDRQIACEVDAYVVSARGPSQGHTTLKFAAKAQTPTKASYTMRVKAIGGTAQYSRDCKFL